MATIVNQLRAMGCKADMIAKATVDGKPLSLAEPKKPSDEWDDGMNKLERGYSWFLDVLVKDGVVLKYRFGSVKLRLADRTWYTADFQVRMASGAVAIVETKGFCRDDAVVKFKVARELYPEYQWMMIGKKDGHWKVFMGDTIAELIP